MKQGLNHAVVVLCVNSLLVKYPTLLPELDHVCYKYGYNVL